jgi:hypothetical protein
MLMKDDLLLKTLPKNACRKRAPNHSICFPIYHCFILDFNVIDIGPSPLRTSYMVLDGCMLEHILLPGDVGSYLPDPTMNKFAYLIYVHVEIWS